MSHLIFKAVLEIFHTLGRIKSIKKKKLTAVTLLTVDTAYSQKRENNSTKHNSRSKQLQRLIYLQSLMYHTYTLY